MAAGAVFYALAGHQLIESAFRGESLEVFNRLISNHRLRAADAGHPRNLDHYFDVGRLLWSRLALTCLGTSVVVVGCLLRREIVAFLKAFFTTATHPVNLGLLRIVLFWTLLQSADVSRTVFFSRLPAELRFEPAALGWVVNHLPWNETWVWTVSNLYMFCCLTAMIGLYSRTSALLTAVLGFYVLGIPQMFGKVNHLHHFVWFPAVLAASRCGDALSVDAMLASWKRADRGVTAPPGPAAAYTAPLRFVAILLGVIYFFAGFWKAWTGGVDWVWSDNLKYQMYSKWLEFGGWVPIFRLDQHPLLCKLAAFSTIAFELSFLGLVFLPTMFVLAPLGGMLFHSMTALFMRISFESLVRCYVVFFDWHGIFTRLGLRLYKDEMYLIYDGGCRLRRRTIASLRVFDILGRVTYLEAADQRALDASGLTWLGANAVQADTQAVVRRKAFRGFGAFRALAARIPFLWPVLPLLYLWPTRAAVEYLYRRIGSSSACRVGERPTPASPTEPVRPFAPAGAVTVIGVLLIVVNVSYGMRQKTHGWPFACYPTFSDRKVKPESESLEIVVLNPAGQPVSFNAKNVSQALGSERWRGLLGKVLLVQDQAERRQRLRALWQLWTQQDPSLPRNGAVQFYRVLLTTIPERQHQNPLRRELLWEFRL